MKFYHDDIAIVDYSFLSPHSQNADEFFDKLLAQEVMLEPIESIADLGAELHTSSDRKQEDMSYSRYGAKFSRQMIADWAKEQSLPTSSCSTLEIILHKLVDDIHSRTPGVFQEGRVECIVGMSTGDVEPSRMSQLKTYEKLAAHLNLSPLEKNRLQEFVKPLESDPDRSLRLLKDGFSSLIFDSIKKRFSISGSCSYVDAACASSLAALMIAVSRLREGDADMVISGGIDVGMTPLTLISFSKLQIFSDEIINPFDAEADGINQGEAAGLFALMRLDRALERNLPVQSVIRNCAGSSDGILGGMVEPTEYGQGLCYKRAYQNVPIQPLTYLECHGTGTSLGDQTELTSTEKFFHPLPPVGSVKANVGHTIGAAGAVSLLKAIKVIERRIIPGLPRFRKMREGFEHDVISSNRRIPTDESIRIGVSSFGFGGANFHLAIDEYRGEKPSPNKTRKSESDEFVVNATAKLDLSYIHELFSTSRFKIPPVSYPYVDPAVLAGILAIENIFTSLKVPLSQKLREDIGVMSNSNSYLERLFDAYERLYYLEIFRRLDSENQKNLLRAVEMPGLKIVEDTFMWSLNNLVSGRATKDFDLKGPNFNVACDKASLGVTLSYARSLVRDSGGAYIILSFEENINYDPFRVKRDHLDAYLVSSLDFSLRANLPILSSITKIDQRPNDNLNINEMGEARV